MANIRISKIKSKSQRLKLGAALRERNLPLTEENIFLVASAIVPGKNMELNEGIRLLTGKARINLPLKAKNPPTEIAPIQPAAAPVPTGVAPTFTGPVTTQCTVVEGGVTRNFRITIEPPAGTSAPAAAGSAAPVAGTAVASTPATGQRTPVFSPFEGKVELVEISVKIGDTVAKGHVVAAVEAMKAKHDVRAPCAGLVVEIHADLGSEVSASKPILTIIGG